MKFMELKITISTRNPIFDRVCYDNAIDDDYKDWQLNGDSSLTRELMEP